MDKIAKMLVAGNHGAHFAKWVAAGLHRVQSGESAMEEPPAWFKVCAEFEATGVCVVAAPAAAAGDEGENDTRAAADTGGLSAWMEKWMGDNQDAVDKKRHEIEKVVAKKNWKSGLAKIDCVLQQEDLPPWGFECSGDYHDDPGAAPWLLGVRPHTWRFGAADIPLQGLGQCVVGLTTSILVCCFDLVPLWEQHGVCVGDLSSFLESPTGRLYTTEHAVLFMLPENGVAWIPYGFAATFVFAPAKEEETSPPLGFVMLWSVFDAGMASTMVEGLWKNVAGMHKKHLEKNGASKIYGSRNDLFKGVDGAVAQARLAST